MAANKSFLLLLFIQLLLTVYPIEYIPILTSNTDIDCDADGVLGPNDICLIRCDIDTDIGNIDCKSAGTCILECVGYNGSFSTGCFETQILNATNTQNLQIYASGESCMERSEIYMPYRGNATIIIDTEGANADRIAESTIFHSQSTDHIFITCIDIFDTGNGECQDMQIFASDAHFLLLTSIGAETYSFAGSGFEVHCPVDSNYKGTYDAPCIINMTYAGNAEDIDIHTKNGLPKDVILYDGTSTDTHVHCLAGSMTYPFSSTDICWMTNNPTSDPTNIPTINPTNVPTINPTNEPTTNMPTTHIPTTYSPTTHAPITNVPTTQYPTTNVPTTYSPTTVNPSAFPTLNPNTFSVTTINPTYNPTVYTTNARDGVVTDVSKDDVTKGFVENKGVEKTNNINILIIVVVIALLAICVFGVIIIMYRRKQMNKAKINDVSNINMAVMSTSVQSISEKNENGKENDDHDDDKITLMKLNSTSGTLGGETNEMNVSNGEIVNDDLLDEDDILETVNVTDMGNDEDSLDAV
eukprot:173546_1